jgi:hypothetical protein
MHKKFHRKYIFISAILSVTHEDANWSRNFLDNMLHFAPQKFADKT